MINRSSRTPHVGGRRRWPTPSLVVSGVALFVALGGSAVAADSMIGNDDLAPNAVTGDKIRNGSLSLKDFSTKMQSAMAAKTSGTDAAGGTGAAGTSGAAGTTGAVGAHGPSGTNGTNGINGIAGPNGAGGAAGANGAAGVNGANGPGGTNGANGVDGDAGAAGLDGTDGTNGTDGLDGTDGTNGTNGTNGANGTITPLAATAGVTALPTTAPSTTVVSLTVPARSYVVLAKTQLTHSGAGDSIECLLKSGATTVDRVAMKTLPALAAIPVSLQAVVTAGASTSLSVVCSVAVANGSAEASSLIAIPVG
jgi:Collagen triple helix repeat (20 copies)